MHLLPPGCSQEQQTIRRTSADPPAGDEPHARSTGRHIFWKSKNKKTKKTLILWGSKIAQLHCTFEGCEVYIASCFAAGCRCYPGQPDVHKLRSCTHRSALWEGWIAAEGSGALHRPVWHQACCGAHTPAQSRGRLHFHCDILCVYIYIFFFLSVWWIGCVRLTHNVSVPPSSGSWISSAPCRWRTLSSASELCCPPTSARTCRSASRWLPSTTNSSPRSLWLSSLSLLRALKVRSRILLYNLAFICLNCNSDNTESLYFCLVKKDKGQKPVHAV